MEEKRLSKRRPYKQVLGFSVSVFELNKLKRLSLNGLAVNISDSGLCIQTDYHLKPGYVLRFYEGIGHRAGIVKWIRTTGNKSVVGIEFV